MKAYKVTLLVVDHDGVAERIPETIESQRYPNHCIAPKVMGFEEADIGEWSDEHPLNHSSTQREEFARLFAIAYSVFKGAGHNG